MFLSPQETYNYPLGIIFLKKKIDGVFLPQISGQENLYRMQMQNVNGTAGTLNVLWKQEERRETPQI